MIYESFIFEFWYLHCTLTLVISIVEIKNKRQTSFKLPASKKAGTWWLKRISGQQQTFVKIMPSSYHKE